jgi:hypothetical protein
LSGFFLDVDHFLDYSLALRPQRNLVDFFQFWATFREKRLFEFLHAWEFIPLLLLADGLGWQRPWTLGLALGLCHHLTLDQIGNGVTPNAYWLSWRCATGFRSQGLLRALATSSRGLPRD